MPKLPKATNEHNHVIRRHYSTSPQNGPEFTHEVDLIEFAKACFQETINDGKTLFGLAHRMGKTYDVGNLKNLGICPYYDIIMNIYNIDKQFLKLVGDQIDYVFHNLPVVELELICIIVTDYYRFIGLADGFEIRNTLAKTP